MSVSQSQFVNVDLVIAPIAKPLDGVLHMLIVGISPNLPVGDNLRTYANIEEIGKDFGESDPEFQAASIYFQYGDNNGNLMIARWFKEDTPGEVLGIDYEADLNKWTVITDGACTLNAPTPIVLGTLDFSTAISLQDVASVVQTAIAASAVTPKPTLTFDGKMFRLELPVTSQAPYYLTTGSGGTDISGMLGLSSDKKPILSNSIPAESITECLLRLRRKSSLWSGFSVAPAFAGESDPSVPSNVALQASAFANGKEAIFFLTVSGADILNSIDNSSIPYQILQLNHDSTCMTFEGSAASFPNVYTDISVATQAFAVDYTKTGTYKTMAYKVLEGVTALDITDEDFLVLRSKNTNAFLMSGGRSFYQTGVLSDGHFIDEITGLMFFRRIIQDGLMEDLGESLSIPQTETGMTTVLNIIAGICSSMVNSGFLAPGITWQGSSIGKVKTGDKLIQGFYLYSDPIDQQPQADKDARRAPPIYILATGAGSIQYFLDITLNYQA